MSLFRYSTVRWEARMHCKCEYRATHRNAARQLKADTLFAFPFIPLPMPKMSMAMLIILISSSFAFSTKCIGTERCLSMPNKDIRRVYRSDAFNRMRLPGLHNAQPFLFSTWLLRFFWLSPVALMNEWIKINSSERVTWLASENGFVRCRFWRFFFSLNATINLKEQKKSNERERKKLLPGVETKGNQAPFLSSISCAVSWDEVPPPRWIFSTMRFIGGVCVCVCLTGMRIIESDRVSYFFLSRLTLSSAFSRR